MSGLSASFKDCVRDTFVGIMVALFSREGFAFRALQESLLQRNLASKILLDPRVFEKIAEDAQTFGRLIRSVKVSRSIHFDNALHTIRKAIGSGPSDENSKARELTARKQYVKNEMLLKEAILSALCTDNSIICYDSPITFGDRESLWILINEILLMEEYFFESRNSKPRIIDCGCHFGLATMYFKHVFPKAEVVAFEPIPEVFALAQENFESAGLQGVRLLPYALSDEETTATFYVSKRHPMGSSLTDRYSKSDGAVEAIEVQCKLLSSYLDQKVDFLKIDIEGAENAVLREAEPLLKNVQNLFVEFHFLDDTTNKRLIEILSILNRQGFDLHVSKSWTSYERSKHRPMTFVGERLSHVIWAKNRQFNEL